MLDVMVPFWGELAYLRTTVASVLAQTDPVWRLVVVDDCYPDPAVEEFVTSIDDPRVHYVRNESNLGITDNYRRCLELAESDWMVFLGCDDVMLPDYVRIVGAAARSVDDHVDVIQPGVVTIDEEGRTVRSLVDRVKQSVFAPRLDGPTTLSGEELAISLLRGNWSYWPSLAFRTSTLRKHDFLDGFPLIQDLALLTDMVLSGSAMRVLPDEVFAYRRHAASASSSAILSGQRFEGERAYFRIAAARCAEQGWHGAARAARVHLASRLYAATQVPEVVRTSSWNDARVLVRHTLSRS